MSRAFIYALPKDPHWMFAWWDLNFSVSADDSVNPSILLRVHDVTDIIFDGTNSHCFFDIDAGSQTRGDWYINVPHAGRVYVIEAGISSEHHFRPLCKSNAALFPPDGRSDDLTQHWTSLAL